MTSKVKDITKDTNNEAQEQEFSPKAPNKEPPMASLVTESQPFKCGILDTLESQPFFGRGNCIKSNGLGASQAQGAGYERNGHANQSLFPDQHIQPLNQMNVQPSLISNAHPIQKGQSMASSMKVMLNCFGQKEMIKDNRMPIKYQNNDPSTGNILLKPILDYIKYLGKQISNQSISYFSEEDECDVFVGIEGASIDDNKTISVDEMGNSSPLKLILNVKPPQDGLPASFAKPLNQVEKQESNSQRNGSNKKIKEECIAVSLPDLNSGTQIDRELGKIIKTIPRDRCTRAEAEAKKLKVSENVKINQKTAEDIQMKNLERAKKASEVVKQQSSSEEEDNNNGSNPENNQSGDAASGNDNQDNDNDELYDSKEESRYQNAPKKQNLNKPKQGGVNHGKDKKAVNEQQSISTVKPLSQPKAVIRAGPVIDDGQKKRTKERTITEIIEKVSTWRKLYNGVMIPNKETKEVQLQRWSLEDAAKKVSVSKKSLDDYLLQLRFGKKFGFDFEKNRESKVGVLRSFVKDQKDQLKKSNGNQKISSKSQLKDA